MSRFYYFICFCVLLIGLIFFAAYLYSSAPLHHLKAQLLYKPTKSEKARIIGLANPSTIKLESISPYLTLGVLAAEDQRFLKHSGFDFKEVKSSFKHALFKGKQLRGASTISQQLMKSIYFPKKRSFIRKIKEAVYTYKLEKNFKKEEILELYLNTVHWGKDIYGISEASEHYFNTSSKNLNLEQAAMLISLLPNPLERSKKLETKKLSEEHIKALGKNLFRLHHIAEYYKDKNVELPSSLNYIFATPLDMIFGFRAKNKNIKEKVKINIKASIELIKKKYFL